VARRRDTRDLLEVIRHGEDDTYTVVLPYPARRWTRDELQLVTERLQRLLQTTEHDDAAMRFAREHPREREPVSATTITERYHAWCVAHGETPRHQRQLSRALTRAGWRRLRRAAGVFYSDRRRKRP